MNRISSFSRGLTVLGFALIFSATAAAAVPSVQINQQAASLQATLYPEYYKLNSVSDDMRWVQRNSDSVTAFWRFAGDSILSALATLSGIAWTETNFDIYLVRYYPTEGEGQPAIIPVGGIRTGVLTEAAPSGVEMRLNVIYQLARRMLAQAQRVNNPARPIADHALFDQTPFRRDNLAMLLAVAVAQKVLGADAATAAYESPFWKRRHVGRIVYEQFFQKSWILSPDRPLAVWVGDEPPRSDLVISTEPPELTDLNGALLSGVPLKGRLGFSTKPTSAGRLEIDKIDGSRLAYGAGLRQGDVINLVDGARVRSAKEMVEAILNGLSRGGATVQIMRNGKTQLVTIQPENTIPKAPPAKP